VLFCLAMAALLHPLIGAAKRGRGRHALTLIAVLPRLHGLASRRRRVRAGRRAVRSGAVHHCHFRKGLALSIVFGAVGSGFLLVFAFAMQAERGQTPLFTGLLHMPYGLGAMFGIGVMSRNLPAALGRWVLVMGAGVMLPPRRGRCMARRWAVAWAAVGAVGAATARGPRWAASAPSWSARSTATMRARPAR
jgi:hypothetical protein